MEAGWELGLRSRCCRKAEGAFGPTARPLIGVGDAVEERRGEARGKGKAALVFLASWGKSDGYYGNSGRRGREQRGSGQVRTQKEGETRTFSPFPVLLHIPSTWQRCISSCIS